MNDIQGKVALITGGTKGIGYGIAQALLAQGLRVAITGRSQESAAQAAKELGNNDEVLAIASDVTLLESQEKAVAQVLEKWGQLDILIANAGIGHFETIDKLTSQQWNDTISTNLTGVFYSVKASLDAIKASKGYILSLIHI